jgi:quercetin dioxygenase-like cupin family protein
VRYALHATEAATDDAGVTSLFGPERGCDLLTQRLVRLAAAESVGDDASDEVLYVLSGRGRATVAGGEHAVAAGTAIFVPRGVRATIDADEEISAVSVLVHDPEPASSQGAVVDLASVERRGATAGRQFVLGATPDVGCASATQFIGLIPPGRAPDHFHTYDEVIYVLAGQGVLEIGGEEAPLSTDACVHLPARLVHCLANTGDAEMRVLGVFRPAGSPAEAYYPDGTLAVVPERS